MLHMPAPMVDALRFLDFLQYIVGIDAYRDAKQKEAGNG